MADPINIEQKVEEKDTPTPLPSARRPRPPPLSSLPIPVPPPIDANHSPSPPPPSSSTTSAPVSVSNDEVTRGREKGPRRPRPGGGPPPPPSSSLSSDSKITEDNLPGRIPTESENKLSPSPPIINTVNPPLSARSTGGPGNQTQRGRPQRPDDLPPPEAFGLLPDGMSVAAPTMEKKDRSRSRPQRPDELPPPEAFGELPDGMAVAAPTMQKKDRSRSRPHRPDEVPPPEAFGELPDGMSIIGPQSMKKDKPSRPPPAEPPPITKVTSPPKVQIQEDAKVTEDGKEVEDLLFNALLKKVTVEIQEEKKETEQDIKERTLREIEAKLLADEAEAAEAEAKAKAEEEERLRLRRKKIASLGPAVPPTPPPKVVPIDTNLIPRGRMEITVQRVIGIGPGTGGNNGKITASTIGNPYIIAELNLGKSRVTAKSNTYKNVLLSDFEPNSIDPPLSLLVTDGVPAPIIPHDMPEAEKQTIPPLLHYSIWLTSTSFMGGSDDLIAEGVIPAAGLFLIPKSAKDIEGIKAAKEGIEIDLPLRGPRIKGNLPQTAAGVFAYMRVHVRFVPAKAGVMCITVHEGRNLKETESINKIHPYPELCLGTQKVKGATVQEGGINPIFNDEELYLWIDHATCIGTEPIKLRAWDAETLFGADFLGGIEIPVLPWTLDADLHQEIYELTTKSGKPGGSLVLSHRFYPAGELTVKICEGKNLYTTDVGGGSDSYAILTLPGRVKTFTNRTIVDSVSGANPIWNETYVYDIVDQADLHIAVMDKDLLTKDDLIGEVTIDLSPVFQYGMRDAWIPIKKGTDWGGFEDRGNIRIEVDFWGPPGISYPLIRADKASFDEKERRSRRGPSAADQEAADKARTALEEQVAKEREQAMKELMGGEFTDKEILEAFDAIDIDKNLVINAAELRHVLTCMGEIITDKEVDMMLSICDTDGDGGVAYYEFYQMAKASNPGDPNWRPISEKDFHEKRSGIDPNKPKPPPVIVYDEYGNPIDVVDAADDAEARKKAMMRASEMARKGEKKRLCEELVDKLDMRLPELQRCFKRFRDMPCFASGRATFDEMCQILDIETDNEFRDIYTVFSDISVGKVNVRELLLALNNFTGCTKPQRINFCFFLFDADQSGEIGSDELVQILQASHLSADIEAVKKKALSILSNADHDGTGSISLEEFIVISNRFPNILFPTYNMTDEDALRGRQDMSSGPISKKFPTKVKKQKVESSRSDIGAL